MSCGLLYIVYSLLIFGDINKDLMISEAPVTDVIKSK